MQGLSLKSMWLKIKEFCDQSIQNKLIAAGATLFALSSVRYVYCKAHRRYSRLPGGPIGIPIFGSLFAFGLNQKDFLSQRALRDGDLSCFYFSAFAKPVILLNDPVTANEVLSLKQCQDRERRTDAVLLNWPDPQSFIDINGEEWRSRRRLFKRILLDAVNNNATFERNAGRYVRGFLDFVQQSGGGLIRPAQQIHYILFMNLYCSVFGGHIEASSEMFNVLSETITTFPEILGIFVVISSNVTLPLFALKWLDRKLGYTKLFQDQFSKFNESLDQFVGFKFDLERNRILPASEQHKNALLSKDDSECNYSEYLIKQCYAGNPHVDCRRIMCDFTITFVAGTETTSFTARYMIYIMSRHQAEQQRVYEELQPLVDDEKANGGDHQKHIDMERILKSNVLRAFVHECTRLAATVTVSVPRQLAADVEYKGYLLPKGSTIFTNMDSCNISSSKWESEEKLDLDHWLDAEGRFKYNSNLASFGFGQRQCPGKLLAMKSLMYLAANIVVNYRIYPGNECQINYGGLTKGCNEDLEFRFEAR